MGQRGNPRISLDAEVSIRCGDRSLLGLLANLSLSGVYIKTDTPIPLGDRAEVIFYDASSPRKSAVKVNGSVVRRDKRGIAFQFRQMDVDSFINMHLMLARQSATV